MKYIAMIDPSTTSTGVAVFQENYELEEVFVLEDCRKLKKPAKMSKAAAKELRHQIMESRVLDMIKHLNWIMNKYHPEKIVMEDSYSDKDPYAYKMLCRLQGTMLEYAIQNDIPIYFRSPSSWRSPLGIKLVKEDGTHNKRPDFKRLAVQMVEERFDMTVKDDIAEAICMGLSEKIREEQGNAFSDAGFVGSPF
ncbi:MAG: hypothetical protein IKN07_12610 [Lachnospiraceae bacterium]|nr:hypothetical protein [Lachnospiraceae bacterium]MBR3736716.1 hypothetical protein [Lachnospiraceae bacterium]